MDNNIVAQTQRLYLRQWQPQDKEPFYKLNSDPLVMEYFPGLLSKSESDAFADRISAQIAAAGWGLWAVELVDTQIFIGFVGLSPTDFDVDFCPCVEIGWRLAREHWGKGYASEAAHEVLSIGFNSINLDEIVSFTSVINRRSQAVMERIGLRKKDIFQHPKIDAEHELRPHILYRLTKTEWLKIKTAGG